MSDLSKEIIVDERRSAYLQLFNQIANWRTYAYNPKNDVKIRWDKLHLSIIRDYFSKFSRIYDFPELPSRRYFIDNFLSDKPKIEAFFTHELAQWFMVPRLKECHETENHIKKYHLVEAFIDFLLKLLHHKTDLNIDPWKDQIDNLEKELRTLFTILGDTSLMLCADEHDEFHKLLAEFVTVANEAGRLVHSLFFSTHRAFRKMKKGIGVVLNHIDLLKANIIKFLNLLPLIRRSAYITPKTSVVDSLLIVDSLIHDLEDLMNQEDNRIADVKDQIKILHQGLILSQSSIRDIGSPQPSEIGELKEPLMRMGDVAHDADYLIISFLGGDAPLWYLITRLNHLIELLGAELQEIAKKYKFGDLKVSKYFSAQPSLQAKSNAKVDDVTVGFEDKDTYLLDQLVGGGTEHLQVISIYGMPGLGKTTLAKKLLNHPLVHYQFDTLSWCVISQTYQKKSILADILIQLKSELGKDSILKMDEESSVECIYKTLKGRRYLIVMDDMWDSNVWDNLRRCFPDDGNGSRILLTTRNKDVAPPNSIIYALPSLSNDQCWELLKKKMFGNEPCPLELLEIGTKIAANCRGLPLAVVVTAGILSTMNKEKSKWEEVEGNLASYISEGGDSSVMPILELSYNHLSEHLKPCFLYLGAFQEDEEIQVGKLMRLWIAEGFIHKEDGKNAENVAEEYLMELIDKSLVMVSEKRSDGGVKTCVVHGLFRDLCLKRSEEENFFKFVKTDVFSICEKSHRIQALEDPICLHNFQQVRSFRGNCVESDFYCHGMRSLRVLHFDRVKSLLLGIECLVNLKYLVIKDLPPSLGSLVNLEYLHLYTSETVYLPSVVIKLKKLRYIHGRLLMYDRTCDSSQTNNLEFLSFVFIGELKDEEMLTCSPHLRKLKCACQWLPNLRFLTRLDSLKLGINIYDRPTYLEEVGFPSSIRKLTLVGADFIGEGISIIGRLENLEVLKLRSITFEDERWDTRDGEFQKLRFLKLNDVIYLTEWNVGSSEHFPLLQQLVLRNCYELQEIPSKISTLQLIEIKGACKRSLVESAKRVQQEQLEMGNEELRVITTDLWFIYKSKTSGNLDFSSKSLMLDLSKETIIDEKRSAYLRLFSDIIRRRRGNGYVRNNEVKIQWSELHLAIVRDYFSRFSTTCDFPELPSEKYFTDVLQSSDFPRTFAHQLEQWFMVPRLKKYHETENHIKKYHLVEAFIDFLLQLLHHKTDSIIGLCKDGIDNLEKELRTLFAILGDTSIMLCADEHDEFHKLLAEFETVANEAGRLVHSLFFSTRRAFWKMKKGIGVVLNHIDLLKADIIKFLNLLPLIRRSAYVTPKTSVVDSLLIVDSLICDLEDLMQQEDNRVADVKDQIIILHQGLLLSRSSIKDIGSPQPSEIGELKEPLMRMGDVAHDAEYLIISFLGGDAPFWYLIKRLIDVNRKIELVGTELQDIAKKYKFGDLKVAKYLSTQPSLQAKSKTEADDVTVALEDKKTYLLDQLVGGGTEHLQVISIYGMPGLGKTTLAKKLLNHPLVQYQFDTLSWHVISQTHQKKSILADVLIQLKSELSKDGILKMDEESSVECIYKTLKGRRYLIVMDDMWDSNVWDNLRRCFPDDGNGSRILLTTRNKDVAPPNSIIYALPSLSNDQCWELLKKKVFSDEPCPLELFEIGMKIAANCRGLPLAVVVIAGILSTMNKEKSKWEEVEGNLASYISEGGDSSVMPILELSYKHLSEHLKPCFLYLGAFQEDEEIHVGKLMRLWIAEGFIHQEDGKNAENVAEEYLMELIDKSLVMVSKKRSDGGVKTCVVHGLFRDLCLKRSEEENFFKFVKTDVFSICEKSHRIQALEDPICLHNCQQVRSFCGNCVESDLYFHGMRSLSVLHFDRVKSHCRFLGTEYLVNLKYLVIKDLSPSLGSLVNLEYLHLYTSETVYLPSTVIKLKKLRYIHGRLLKYNRDCYSSQTNNLEFLSYIFIGKLKDEEMLKCSPHLRKLKCSFQRLPNLRFLTQLDSLKLAINIYGRRIHMEEVGFPSNIRKLTLSGKYYTWEGMSIIGRLEKLEVLKLRGINFKDERWDTRYVEFQKLRFLELNNVINLTVWNVASSEHFPRLQQLVLTDCYKLPEIPSEISALQLIEIKGGCKRSLVESAKRIQQEQLEMGNEELRVITTDSRFMYSKIRGNTDFSSKSVMLDLSKEIITDKRNTYLHLFEEVIRWWMYQYSHNNEVEIQGRKLHLSIVREYFSKFSTIYDFPELPSTKYFSDKFSSSDFPRTFAHELEQWFMVPRLHKLYDGNNHVKKYHLVEAFIGFLLELLHHKTDLNIDPWKDQIDNLEKELRTLFTILGDTSLMLCADEHEEFHKLLAEFEAVANEAGRLLHSLIFSTDRAFGKTNERIGVVLNHIDLLKADIMKFIYFLPLMRRSACITPKTSTIDSLLIVDSLIYDLEELMKQKDNRIADVKDQIKILHHGLILSLSFIKDIGSPKPSEIGELKEPLMRMGDVAHDAEYLVISFLGGDAPLWYLIDRLTDANSKIELIGTELQQIAKKYKFGDQKVSKYFSAQPSLQAKSNTKVDDVTVGFEGKETYILDLLVGGREQQQVISIYGMPGLGKTTLAKKLYNHRSVNSHFDRLSWCVVSQEYRRQRILTDILIQLKSELGKDCILTMDEESLVEHIHKTLKGRRYLIVMDDMWDLNVWDNLRGCFPDDGNGSRILLTTRNKDVAPPDSRIYALPSLSNDQCWKLLKKKVFSNEPCPLELFEIGTKIAANCRGLPLAVVVTAGILSTMNKEKSKWEEVEGNLASYIFEAGDSSVMQILELSYKHLSEHLKPCFLYLGAFQEDEEIHVRKLMRLWIAEGFIHKEGGKNAENVAEDYLMELIDKSLVMVSKKRSDGGAKTCVVHDLFRDLCLKRSEEENFFKFVKTDILSICEKGHRIQALGDPIYLHNCHQFRSFYGVRLGSGLYVREMRLLRILHFNDVQNDGHYIGIQYVVNLRYLVIEDLPPSIGSLVNLEYLSVRTYKTVYLPPAIMKMKKLRYIHGYNVQYDEDCNNSSENNLEFLSGIVIRNLKDEEMLKCSPHLRKLKCTCKSEKNSPYIFDFRFLTQLDSLNLNCHSYHGFTKLEEVGFPSNIRKLTLNGYGSIVDGISIIGRLENLEVLKLRSTTFEDERWDTRDGEFQKLRYLELYNIQNLTEWNVASSEHFPRLQQLVLTGCSTLQEIPNEIGEIPTLQLIDIKGKCTESLVESIERIREQGLETGNEEPKVILDRPRR